jgi:CHAD domain-containing protein
VKRRAVVCANPAHQHLLAVIDDALRKLRARTASDHGIHGVRKDLKKARAALRLLRDGMGEIAYRAENTALRDAGRQLSPLRDAKALLEAFEAFQHRYASEVRQVELRAVHRALRDERTRARRKLREARGPLDKCRRALQAHRRRMQLPEMRAIDPAVLKSGFVRIYRKGRRAKREVDAKPSAAALHEWRKQVKYLRNAIEGVQDLLGRGAGKIGARADDLADELGEDHDLVVLRGRIAAGPVDADTARTMRGLIQRRRAKLQKHARKLGQQVYARKPRRFVAQLLKHSPLAAAMP